ncbi:MAG TPA: four-carbon acid sugar kinase family protein [Spirillospora sp.]|nr:four-carbon acid sugar kinase family protein [Spirillospora sp.]
MHIKFGVIADDLSGGMNIGVEFSSAGMQTLLVQDVSANRSEVLIIDTETRNQPPDAAYAKVHVTALALRELSPGVVVKKIDSLLRGSIGQELEAVREVFGFEKCLLVAASPRIGRKTVGGYHYVEGHLLEMVRSQVDPSSLVEGSHVPTILAGQTKLAIELVGLDTIYQGAEAIQAYIQQSEAFILVADCEEQADLNRVVEAAYAAGVRLFAGTYGLGEALSRLFHRPTRATLFVIGTLSAVAYRQIERLKEELPCQHIQIDYERDFLDVPVPAYAAGYREQLLAALDQSEYVILQLSSSPDMALWLWQEAEQRGLSRADVSARIDSLLQHILQPVPANLGGFVATGGATAHSLFRRLGADGLRLEVREVLPGVPGARLVGGPRAGLPFVAKPGSQGMDDALVRLARYVREANLSAAGLNGGTPA